MLTLELQQREIVKTINSGKIMQIYYLLLR